MDVASARLSMFHGMVLYPHMYWQHWLYYVGLKNNLILMHEYREAEREEGQTTDKGGKNKNRLNIIYLINY